MGLFCVLDEDLLKTGFDVWKGKKFFWLIIKLGLEVNKVSEGGIEIVGNWSLGFKVFRKNVSLLYRLFKM